MRSQISKLTSASILTGIVSLLVIGLVVRLFIYVSLDTKWNNNERIIRKHLHQANTLQVMHEQKPNEIWFELTAKSEVQHFLYFLDFEPNIDISFWHYPMIPERRAKPRKYIKDSIRIRMLKDDQELGHFWIQPYSRELTFIPMVVSDSPPAIPENGTLTQASYNNIAYWFLTYGVPHYAKTIPLNQKR